MGKVITNPFGNDSTSNPSVQNESAPLPERGTGLKTGAAGERRGGQPRTEEERRERHDAILDDHSDNSEFIKTEEDGKVIFTRKGYENETIPSPINRKPKSIKQQWAEHYAKKAK